MLNFRGAAGKVIIIFTLSFELERLLLCEGSRGDKVVPRWLCEPEAITIKRRCVTKGKRRKCVLAMSGYQQNNLVGVSDARSSTSAQQRGKMPEMPAGSSRNISALPCAVAEHHERRFISTASRRRLPAALAAPPRSNAAGNAPVQAAAQMTACTCMQQQQWYSSVRGSVFLFRKRVGPNASPTA